MYRDKLLLKNYSELQCPECFKEDDLKLHQFSSLTAISNHIVKSHQISEKDFLTIKKLIRKYRKSNNKSFIKFCFQGGYLK